jgi:hypothetical protein
MFRFPDGCRFTSREHKLDIGRRNAPLTARQLMCSREHTSVTVYAAPFAGQSFGAADVPGLMGGLGVDPMLANAAVPGRSAPVWHASGVRAGSQALEVQITQAEDRLVVAVGTSSMEPPPMDPEVGMAVAREGVTMLHAVESLRAGEPDASLRFPPRAHPVDAAAIRDALRGALKTVSPPTEANVDAFPPTMADRRAELSWRRTNEAGFDDSVHLRITECETENACGEAVYEYAASMAALGAHLEPEGPKGLGERSWGFAPGKASVAFSRCGVHFGVFARGGFEVDVSDLARTIDGLVTPIVCGG